MKIFSLLIYSSFYIFSSYAQGVPSEYNRNTIDFFKTNFNPSSSHIVVAENLDLSAFLFVKSILRKDTFYKKVSYDGGATIVIDSFILNKKERNVIDSFFSKYENFSWKDDRLVANSEIVSRKVIDSVRSSNGKIDDALQKYYHVASLFFLSKPIFLRNYSICIFYSEKSTSFFGAGYSLIIYKKINGKWKPYHILSQTES